MPLWLVAGAASAGTFALVNPFDDSPIISDRAVGLMIGAGALLLLARRKGVI